MTMFLYSLLILALCIAFFVFGFFVGGHMGIKAFRKQYDKRLNTLLDTLKKMELREINRDPEQYKKDLANTKFMQ